MTVALAQVEWLSLALAGVSAVGAVLSVLLAVAEQRHPDTGVMFDTYRALGLVSGINLGVSLALTIEPRMFYDDYLATSLGGMALWLGPGLGITFFLSERLKHARGTHPLQRPVRE